MTEKKELPEWLERLTPEEIKGIVETWHLTVQPFIDGLNSIQAEEKLKELPDVFETIADAQQQADYNAFLKLDRPDRDKIADIIFPFRWFFSNNRDDALDLADQILALCDVGQAKHEERERIIKIIESHTLIEHHEENGKPVRDGLGLMSWWQALKEHKE